MMEEIPQPYPNNYSPTIGSNYGKCNFEEKTGNKCRFLHQMAPLCRNGINCNRLKCMYAHPKPSPSFLNNAPTLSPWQLCPPWMSPQLHQMLPSSWPQQQQQQVPTQQQTPAQGPIQNNHSTTQPPIVPQFWSQTNMQQ